MTRVGWGMTRGGLEGIYVIVNEDGRAVKIAAAVLDAGVGIVQYRAKNGIIAENLRDLRELTREHDALLIVNDDWRTALEFDCDGVHLGPDDAGFSHLASVREALGNRIIGISCGTIEDLVSPRAECLADTQPRGSISGSPSTTETRRFPPFGMTLAEIPIDYIGTGPVYSTSSKSDAGEPIGLSGLKLVVEATPLPVCAIGGIAASHIRDVKVTGAKMAAVISAVANAADPGAAARELVDAWKAA